MTKWEMQWDHGSLSVYAKGGMLGDLTFTMPNGDMVSPLYKAPWLDEGRKLDPAILENLRGEFPCVPFGGVYPAEAVSDDWRASVSGASVPEGANVDSTDTLLHGYGSEAEWTLVSQTGHHIAIAVDYPESSPIARVERQIVADPICAKLTFSLKIHARRECRRPLGIHPNFALRSAERMELNVGRFNFGVVHPAGPEQGVSRAIAGSIFYSLRDIPMTEGGAADFSRVPLPFDTEEIVQLCGVDGEVQLTDRDAGATYRLTWDPSILPSLLLWISNRGRAYEPWNGRNLCLGVEPVAAAFDLGTVASISPNPINALGVSTASTLMPSAPLIVRYTLEALRA
mgnify:FL=1